MRKMIPVTMAALMALSTIPVAFATNDYTQGTQVEYTATQNEEYLITVPAKLTPGASGTVKLEGAWPDNKIIIVTADANVTLTNSLKENDKKVLNINFAGIEEAGDNTQRLTFTESVSVDDISGALFGVWDGKFNYNVSTRKVGAPVIPEGGQYTKADGTVLSPGDEFPMPATGDKYRFGDYEYAYNQSSALGNLTWVTREEQNGWGVDTISNSKTTYEPILTNIGGTPITSLKDTFWQCSNLQTAPAIPETTTNMHETFGLCSSLTTASAVPANVTDFEAAYYGCSSLQQAPDFSQAKSITTMKSAFVGSGLVNTDGMVLPNTVTDFSGVFQRCEDLVDVSGLVLQEGVKNMVSCFSNCTALVDASFTVPSTATNINSLFSGCSSLKQAPDISKVVQQNYLWPFEGCSSLEYAPVINDDVIYSLNAFRNCTSLQVARIHCGHGASNFYFTDCAATIEYYHRANCTGCPYGPAN